MERESMRVGFGRGLVSIGHQVDNVIVLSADLAESTQVSLFQEAFPDAYKKCRQNFQSLW